MVDFKKLLNLVEVTSRDGAMTGLVVGVGLNVSSPIWLPISYLPVSYVGDHAGAAFTKTPAEAIAEWLIPERIEKLLRHLKY